MKKIQELLQEEWKCFEHEFTIMLQSDIPLLKEVMNYVVTRKGKQIRPLFVLLVAKLFQEQLNQKTYRAAALVELLHTATIIHDDVVDEAFTRRGTASINALWKNKIAVLTGDYLFSKGMATATEYEDLILLKILADTGKLMSEGELLQIEQADSLSMDENIYLKIIRYKTACLLGAACAAGASSVATSIETIATMSSLGEKIGIAFQIRDDLLDYDTYNIGKPTKKDIQDKKITLPLIYTLQHASSSDKEYIMAIVANDCKEKNDIAAIIKIIKATGGIDYAEKKIERYKQEALEILWQFPQNTIRDLLESLIHYSAHRVA